MEIRKIIHIDLDAFFCAVEELHQPGLVGKPFAVGGKPEHRGVVASCSYAARQFGVRSAMPMARAIKICPELIIVPPRHGLYGEISDQVMDHLRSLTPLIEQISIDEAFLEISGLPGPAEDVARRLQGEILSNFSLPCSLGVATNKLVAKIATDAGKRRPHSAGPPNAITIVAPGDEAGFLAPLPVEALWGVGPKTGERLAEMGVLTIGDLAQQEDLEFARLFGKVGIDLIKRAKGIDESPIITTHEVKSISQETTFSRDIREEAVLKRTLVELSERVGRRLRQSHLRATTVKLKLRWPDFTTITRQVTLSEAIDLDAEIQHQVALLFDKVWRRGRAVRLLGVGVSGFGGKTRQLSLWDVPSKKEQSLQDAVDSLQEKFGKKSVHRGNLAKE